MGAVLWVLGGASPLPVPAVAVRCWAWRAGAMLFSGGGFPWKQPWDCGHHCSGRDILGMSWGECPEVPHPSWESLLWWWEGFGFISGGWQ